MLIGGESIRIAFANNSKYTVFYKIALLISFDGIYFPFAVRFFDIDDLDNFDIFGYQNKLLRNINFWARLRRQIWTAVFWVTNCP